MNTKKITGVPTERQGIADQVAARRLHLERERPLLMAPAEEARSRAQAAREAMDIAEKESRRAYAYCRAWVREIEIEIGELEQRLRDSADRRIVEIERLLETMQEALRQTGSSTITPHLELIHAARAAVEELKVAPEPDAGLALRKIIEPIVSSCTGPFFEVHPHRVEGAVAALETFLAGLMGEPIVPAVDVTAGAP